MNNSNHSTGRLPRRAPLRAAIAAVTLTLAGSALAEQSATEAQDPTHTQSEYETQSQSQSQSEYGTQSEHSTQMGDTAQTEDFDELDEDGDGYLDQNELAQSDTAGAVLEELDADNDGQVSRTEFAALESATMGSGAHRTEDSPSSGGTETYPGQDTGTETDSSESTWSSDDQSSSAQSSTTTDETASASSESSWSSDEDTASTSSDSSWSSDDTSSTASTDTSTSQSSDSDTGMSDAGQSENAQAVAQIAEQQESLSTFTKALQQTGIADGLTDNDKYTIFAPTNEAFEARSGKSAEELMKPENREELVSLLRAHIVADDVDEKMAQEISEARTLDGGTVSVSSQDGELKIGDASVVESQIEQGSLRVYPIDAVLEPQADAQMAATDTGTDQQESATDTGSTQQLSEMDFDELDQDGDGYLTDEELQGAEGLADANTSADEMDTDQDGQVSRTEFAAFEQSPDAGQSAHETESGETSSWESDRSDIDEPEGSQYESQPDPQ